MIQGRGEIGERRMAGGGDAVADHEVLGESLGGLDLRGGAAGAKTAQPGGLERVDDALGQRRFRSHDGQGHAVACGEVDQATEIALLQVNVGDLAAGQRRAAVAGRNQHATNLRRLRQLPGQRMFAPAATDDENRA